jgi:hypothetical protein
VPLQSGNVTSFLIVQIFIETRLEILDNHLEISYNHNREKRTKGSQESSKGDQGHEGNQRRSRRI